MIKYSNAIDINSLNHRVRTAPSELVELAERNYNQQLDQVVRTVAEAQALPHFLLLAGPSASSKTTTANKIMQKLIDAGVNARVISLDDFYIDRDDLPSLPNGDTDFESINTLDLIKLRDCLNELIANKKSNFPVFDFNTGKRSEKVNPVAIDGHTVLIMEGLHALNPVITNGLSGREFVKLYISPTSDYYCGRDLIVSAREIRLMRRIIRDYFYRSSSIENTMEMWVNVVIAEVDSIIPFEKFADFVIDSTIIYEPCIYSRHLFAIIDESEPVSGIFSKQMESIKKAASTFALLEEQYIPVDTVIHEFLK